jgi:SulP family sulfate permease
VASLIAGALAAHLGFTLAALSLEDARLGGGWLFHARAAVGLAETWDLRDLRMFRWNIIPALSGDLLAVMFVTAITMLLNTGIECLTKREADL